MGIFHVNVVSAESSTAVLDIKYLPLIIIYLSTKEILTKAPLGYVRAPWRSRNGADYPEK